jgi:hypothetical protein
MLICQKINRPTTVSSALNVKKNALREFQYPSTSKRRMPGWIRKNSRQDIISDLLLRQDTFTVK